MARVVAALLALAIVVYALADCIQTPSHQTRVLPKALWIVAILLLPVLGAAAWLAFGHERQANGPTRRTGPLGPDDDPDFLRGL
ncbi:PLD nuclease N-terminal domain-containing protein [Dermacoccaceae bacterium W4C1]